ncbi:MAG: hypothetical protein HYX69_14310 [Planctomycetia bacterium]|nr:hypothetical protein [Planctomycetia bacterium]
MLLIISPALAGPLNGDPFALVSGSTPYNNFVGLSGTVDWAVYLPGAFPYGGYGPTPGQVVYAYQVIADPGSFAVSHLSVALLNPANNIGDFPLAGGTPPSSALLTPLSSADWFFTPEATLSSGLAYSSPFLPIDVFGSVVDGGTSSFVIPLPSPGTEMIPEPGSFVLLSLGLVFAVPVAVRRLRRRS